MKMNVSGAMSSSEDSNDRP